MLVEGANRKWREVRQCTADESLNGFRFLGFGSNGILANWRGTRHTLSGANVHEFGAGVPAVRHATIPITRIQ